MKASKVRLEETAVQVGATAVKSREDFRKHQTLQVVALRDIIVGEKLCADYGVDYRFGTIATGISIKQNELAAEKFCCEKAVKATENRYGLLTKLEKQNTLLLEYAE